MARSTLDGGRRRARKKKDDKYFALSLKPPLHSRSPLSDIPPDILHLVADLLDFRSFCALRRTCRGICKWLQKMFVDRYGPDHLKQDLSFDSMDSSRNFIEPMFSSKIVTIDFLASDFDNARFEREKLTLHPNCRAIRKHRNDKRHVELASKGAFATMLADWLSKYPNLKIIRLRNQMLPFVDGDEVVHEAAPLGSWPFSTLIAALSRANISLAELSLHDTRDAQELDHSLIRTDGTIADVGALSNLKTMRLEFKEHFYSVGMNYLARNIELPNLKALIIDGSIDDEDLKKLLKKHKGTLREFTIMTDCTVSPNANMILNFTRQHLSLDHGQPVIFYDDLWTGRVVLDH
ncbi:hypothetical protein DBV05_g12224 [Lasiodiplodia theobromae]|uniref:F-box domain-containing protein n=1 Tax=Lasiodiplodia theobromae TaxID=45133 RepID=A0A5N5CUS0_9PEZI|nr:hypothetical protein DBV05_g12224 [Lasiodiplodia theobromae]